MNPFPWVASAARPWLRRTCLRRVGWGGILSGAQDVLYRRERVPFPFGIDPRSAHPDIEGPGPSGTEHELESIVMGVALEHFPDEGEGVGKVAGYTELHLHSRLLFQLWLRLRVASRHLCSPIRFSY